MDPMEQEISAEQRDRQEGMSADMETLMFTSNKEALENLSKEELLLLVSTQRQYLAKLRMATDITTDHQKSTQTQPDDTGRLESPKAKKPKNRPAFDFSRFKVRHVALKFLYLGWDYRGYVVQDDTDKTIEAAIFEALIRTKLVKNRENANYHRCGRTDKGVSAFSQVITLDLRTNLEEGVGVVTPPDYQSDRARAATEEINYIKILNRVLPPEIRMIAWAPVDPKLSARFDCRMRSYRYFFPRGRLNVELMREAARLLEGEHDFRNLCKMDVGNGVVQFRRKVEAARIDSPEGNGASDMCCFVIKSNAFLWHQIRCIVAVLLLVGEGKESPSIVSELLEVEKNPRKPQYSMASEIPLCLYESHYDSFEWIYSNEILTSVIEHLVRQWTTHSIKSSMISSMIGDLCSLAQYQPRNHADPLLPGPRSRTYKPLLERDTCESLESRIEYYNNKKRQK